MVFKFSAPTAAVMAAAVGLAGCGMARAQAPQANAPGRAAPSQTERLEIVTAHGPVRFNVEIADDDAERERGLMFRKSLSDNHGMLFEFEQSAEQHFWMQNTLIPLDMIFIAPDGHIVSISKMAKPLSQDNESSTGPAIGVLEIRGGLADQDGIKPGDMVRHRFFPAKTRH